LFVDGCWLLVDGCLSLPGLIPEANLLLYSNQQPATNNLLN